MSSPPSPPEPIMLPANANLAAAEALVSELRLAAAAGPVRVDASAVEAIGQGMVQLLLAAARTPHGLELTAVSDPFHQRIQQLGLKELGA